MERSGENGVQKDLDGRFRILDPALEITEDKYYDYIPMDSGTQVSEGKGLQQRIPPFPNAQHTTGHENSPYRGNAFLMPVVEVLQPGSHPWYMVEGSLRGRSSWFTAVQSQHMPNPACYVMPGFRWRMCKKTVKFVVQQGNGTFSYVPPKNVKHASSVWFSGDAHEIW